MKKFALLTAALFSTVHAEESCVDRTVSINDFNYDGVVYSGTDYQLSIGQDAWTVVSISDGTSTSITGGFDANGAPQPHDTIHPVDIVKGLSDGDVCAQCRAQGLGTGAEELVGEKCVITEAGVERLRGELEAKLEEAQKAAVDNDLVEIQNALGAYVSATNATASAVEVKGQINAVLEQAEIIASSDWDTEIIQQLQELKKLDEGETVASLQQDKAELQSVKDTLLKFHSAGNSTASALAQDIQSKIDALLAKKKDNKSAHVALDENGNLVSLQDAQIATGNWDQIIATTIEALHAELDTKLSELSVLQTNLETLKSQLSEAYSTQKVLYSSSNPFVTYNGLAPTATQEQKNDAFKHGVESGLAQLKILRDLQELEAIDDKIQTIFDEGPALTDRLGDIAGKISALEEWIVGTTQFHNTAFATLDSTISNMRNHLANIDAVGDVAKAEKAAQLAADLKTLREEYKSLTDDLVNKDTDDLVLDDLISKLQGDIESLKQHNAEQDTNHTNTIANDYIAKNDLEAMKQYYTQQQNQNDCADVYSSLA